MDDNDKKVIIEELLKLPEMELVTALAYAKGLTLYGVDVTEKWLTATQMNDALSRAYEKGRIDERKYIIESRNAITQCD